MIAEVILPVPLDKRFYYSITDSMHLEVGDYVHVPFSHRTAIGVVTALKEDTECDMKLKCISSKVQLPPIQLALLAFVKWVSNYNLIPIGTVLKMVFGGVLTEKLIHASYLRDIVTHRNENQVSRAFAVLSQEQNRACESISERLCGFSVTVLDGKTGSGKTEVYCSVMVKLLQGSSCAQVLILLPEIVLATQLMKRVYDYFVDYDSVEWHSGLTAKKRRLNWLAIAYGNASIVVGARSALFLPFKNLKMIVVDEEHESSFKQDCGIIYNARDMAIVLARQLDIPIILCSATPALETMHNVQRKKYHHHVVLKHRFGDAVMPDITFVDMRKDKLVKSWLSSRLYDEITKTLSSNCQAMLFLNRRGYARLVLCKKCGYKISCPHCCTWLTEHRRLGALLCHYCAYTCEVPRQCDGCSEYNSMIPYGVGIERVSEEIRELIPSARVAIISSDVSTKDINGVIEQILRREIDIIVGTQIIAKGHNFPKLTLVGVLDADLGLGNSDLRATEKTYQLLHQVSGRSGRFEEKGKVVLQTHDPESVVIKSLLSCNREDFYNMELHSRMVTRMPPYARLIAVIVSGKEECRVVEVAKDIAAHLVQHMIVWGPVPAPMSFVKGRYRYRMLLKVHNVAIAHELLVKCREQYKRSKQVRMAIDVDPMNFL